MKHYQPVISILPKTVKILWMFGEVGRVSLVVLPSMLMLYYRKKEKIVEKGISSWALFLTLLSLSTMHTKSAVACEQKVRAARLKVAAVSCVVYYRQPGENLKQIAKWTRVAAHEGADIVLFNETCITGYIYSREIRDFAQPLSGPWVGELTKLASENNIVICAGMPEKSFRKVYNTQVLVGPKGLIGFHRKSSLPSGEEQRFDIGHDTNVFVVRGVKVGIAICFESVHSETCRALARKGAQVILAPYSNGVTAREIHERKRLYFQDRARENGVWYVACDESHIDNNSTDAKINPGAVCFVSPDGSIVQMTNLNDLGEHMIVHELNIQCRQ